MNPGRSYHGMTAAVNPLHFHLWLVKLGKQVGRRFMRRAGVNDGGLPASDRQWTLSSVYWGYFSPELIWWTAPIITRPRDTDITQPQPAHECSGVHSPSLLQCSRGGADRQVTPPVWPPRFFCSVAVGTCHTFTVVSRLNMGGATKGRQKSTEAECWKFI